MERESRKFEQSVTKLDSKWTELMRARRRTIKKLRESADHLDTVWHNCRISNTVGTSTSIVGGVVTIGGGVLTLLTGGLATPLLLTGIGLSAAGSATSLGTSIAEQVINSNEISSAEEALKEDQEIAREVKNLAEEIRSYKNSAHLMHLVILLESMYKTGHPIYNAVKGLLGLAPGQGAALVSRAYASAFGKSLSGATNIARSGAESAGLAASKSAKVTGRVAIGASAVFLILDAVDLGFSISSLVKMEGSGAAKKLRSIADELEEYYQELLKQA